MFTPYQGRIIALYGSVGDDVKKGQTLFTIDSPDLLTAESTLIAAAGVLELTTRNLTRLNELRKTLAVSQPDVDQATSDHQDRRRQPAGGARLPNARSRSANNTTAIGKFSKESKSASWSLPKNAIFLSNALAIEVTTAIRVVAHDIEESYQP